MHAELHLLLYKMLNYILCEHLKEQAPARQPELKEIEVEADRGRKLYQWADAPRRGQVSGPSALPPQSLGRALEEELGISQPMRNNNTGDC